MMAAAQVKPGLLNSWKEIASYLGRGVRTVQRWEKLGLPVRRLSPGPRTSVIASTRDIDGWLNAARVHGFKVSQDPEHLLFRGALVESIEQLRLLRQEAAVLREGNRHVVVELMDTVTALEKSCSTEHGAIPRPLTEKNVGSYRPNRRRSKRFR